jgi:hypothetical protein
VHLQFVHESFRFQRHGSPTGDETFTTPSQSFFRPVAQIASIPCVASVVFHRASSAGWLLSQGRLQFFGRLGVKLSSTHKDLEKMFRISLWVRRI